MGGTQSTGIYDASDSVLSRARVLAKVNNLIQHFRGRDPPLSEKRKEIDISVTIWRDMNASSPNLDLVVVIRNCG